MLLAVAAWVTMEASAPGQVSNTIYPGMFFFEGPFALTL